MIPKAEEFYDKRIKGIPMSFNEKMIEFAKLHVEAALTEASENADTIYRGYSFGDYIVDKDSILNAYSLENIK
jgi:hypothetical protein